MKPRRAEGELTHHEKFQARQYREVGMSINDLAAWFKVSRATVHRALAEMRELHGPEKLPEHRRQYARPTLRKTSLNSSQAAESSN